MNCPHCDRRLEDDGISLRCPSHGPIEISPDRVEIYDIVDQREEFLLCVEQSERA